MESLLNEGNSIPRRYEPVELNGDHTYRVTDRFSPSITEAVYGLGQHQSGMFNNRFPLDMKLTSIAGKSIDYYFLYGPEIDTILHEYRTMTGHTALLPKWA